MVDGMDDRADSRPWDAERVNRYNRQSPPGVERGLTFEQKPKGQTVRSDGQLVRACEQVGMGECRREGGLIRGWQRSGGKQRYDM